MLAGQSGSSFMYSWTPQQQIETARISTTTKGTSNSQGPINMFRSPPQSKVLVQAKALTIMPFGLIKKSSIPIRLKFSIGQKSKADPWSLSNREMIIPLYSTAMCAFNIPGPFPSEFIFIGSSVFVLAICSTICCRSFVEGFPS